MVKPYQPTPERLQNTGEPSKILLIQKITELPENSPVLSRLYAVIEGRDLQEHDEKLLNFRQLAESVGVDESWLRRLGIHRDCGFDFAGSRRYHRSEVIDFLSSPQCRERAKKSGVGK